MLDLCLKVGGTFGTGVPMHQALKVRLPIYRNGNHLQQLSLL